jgi:hypothetical protein
MKLPETWSEIGFEVEITGDGSPSLRLLKPTYADGDKGESMHHSGGAAAETELIYGRVLRRCFSQVEAPHFLSVGLGLGYVEMTVAREAFFKQNLNFTLESFESISELKNLLLAWLQEWPLPPVIQTVYDQVLAYVLKDSSVPGADLKNLLLKKLSGAEWHVQGALAAGFQLMKPAHVLLFDAFSSKTTPDLWDEDFLSDFFRRGLQTDGMVSTYACRVSLKRALQATGFQVEVREGFQGKRNSTLGVRGAFTSAPAETSLRNL